MEKKRTIKKWVVKLLSSEVEDKYVKLPAYLYVNEIYKKDELNTNLVTQYQP